MKILMLGWELPPHNSGGLGVVCYQLCQTLAHNGVDIEFILPYKTDSSVDFMRVKSASHLTLEEGTSPFVGAYDSRRYSQNGTYSEFNLFEQQLNYQNSVAKLVETAEFDVIHAHDWLTFRAAMLAKQLTNKPLVIHIHSLESDRAAGGYGNPMVREIEYLACMLADRIIAVSELTRQKIANEYHVPLKKIEVIHNSVDVGSIDFSEDENIYKYLVAMKKQGYKVVANVGRLTIQKGLPNLLQAAKLVIERRPKTIFLIVGSGEQYHELIDQAAALGIANKVVFTGFARGKAWRDSFRVADLFVMPSVSEPFGITPLEAAIYDTPSLISKQSGVAEVFKNCLKVDYWDVNEIANQMLAVLNNDSLNYWLAQLSRKEFEQLSWQPAAERLINLYEQELAGTAA